MKSDSDIGGGELRRGKIKLGVLLSPLLFSLSRFPLRPGGLFRIMPALPWI